MNDFIAGLGYPQAVLFPIPVRTVFIPSSLN